MATKKPYYKLVIGTTKPRTNIDAKFGSAGRIRVEVSDDYPDADKLLADLFDMRWPKMLGKVWAWMEANPFDYELTEPHDRYLADEVVKLGVA